MFALLQQAAILALQGIIIIVLLANVSKLALLNTGIIMDLLGLVILVFLIARPVVVLRVVRNACQDTFILPQMINVSQHVPLDISQI